MADFFAVESGHGAEGYLVVNGNVYPAVSGPFGKGDIPAGDYVYGKAQPLNPSNGEYRSMTNSGTKRAATAAEAAAFRKFHIGKVNPDEPFKDPRTGQIRSGVELHYDGNTPGTLGCIGYQDPAAKDALIADPDKTLHVQYDSSIEQSRANVERVLGRKINWDDVEKMRRHIGKGSGGSGDQSRTVKGNKVQKGNATVLLGPKNRQVAHVAALLDSGHQVAQGSSSVFVGPERLQVARVNDATTDGSPITSGESSILVG